jgi:tight adherence protein C
MLGAEARFEWLLLAAICLTGSGFAFLLLQRSAQVRRRREDRLQIGSGEDISRSQDRLLFGRFSAALAAQIPMTQQSQAELQADLTAAGFYRRAALQEYRALRTVLVLAPLLIVATAGLIFDGRRFFIILGASVIAAILGFSLPRLYIQMRGKARGRMILSGLPFAVDLLALCLTAGQNMLAALRWVSRDLRHSYGELASELEITCRHAELHSVVTGLENLADRVRLPAVQDLTLILTQSERLGTNTAAALLEFAAGLRLTLRQRAEMQANRTSFWMLFPTLFCFWIGSAILLFGPIYYDFWQQRRAGVELLKNAGSTVRDVNRPASANPSPTPATPFP